MASIASGDGPNGFSFEASLIMGTPDSCCACRMGLPGTYPARALMCSGICARTVFFITNERTTEVCITISVALLGTGEKHVSKGFQERRCRSLLALPGVFMARRFIRSEELDAGSRTALRRAV